MRTPTLLFVDDDTNLLESISRSLARQPFRVRVAAGGLEAKALLDEEEIDVLVADENMPGMRGSELIQWVRHAHPGVIRILLTGNPSVETALQAINEGEVYRFLTKPCPAVDLAATVRQALNHKLVLDEARRLLGELTTVRDRIDAIGKRSRVRIPRDQSGAIVVHEVASDLDGLVREMEAAMEQAESRVEICASGAGVGGVGNASQRDAADGPEPGRKPPERDPEGQAGSPRNPVPEKARKRNAA